MWTHEDIMHVRMCLLPADYRIGHEIALNHRKSSKFTPQETGCTYHSLMKPEVIDTLGKASCIPGSECTIMSGCPEVQVQNFVHSVQKV